MVHNQKRLETFRPCMPVNKHGDFGYKLVNGTIPFFLDTHLKLIHSKIVGSMSAICHDTFYIFSRCRMDTDRFFRFSSF